MSTTKETQSWLAGEDDRLESFFSSRSLSRIGAGSKRKRTSSSGKAQARPSGSSQTSSKKQTLLDKTLVRRVSKSKPTYRPSTMPTPTTPKKQYRLALVDVTTHQNSPRRKPSADASKPSAPLNPHSISSSISPAKKEFRRLIRTPTRQGSRSASLNQRKTVRPRDGDDEVVNGNQPSSPTRKLSRKRLGTSDSLIFAPPTPPSTTAGPERVVGQRDALGPYTTPSVASLSSTSSKHPSSTTFSNTWTPLPALFVSTSSGKPQSTKALPTPESLAVHRLRQDKHGLTKRIPAPPLLADVSFKRPKDPPPSVIIVEDSEDEDGLILPKLDVPSSQTQYLHYSPTKPKASRLSLQKLRSRIFAPELPKLDKKGKGQATDVVPSSQAELVPDSPRKVRLRTLSPIMTTPTKERTSGSRGIGYIVPTSQEDEKEMETLRRGSLLEAEAKLSSNEKPANEIELLANTPTSLSPLTPLSTSFRSVPEPFEGHGRETNTSLPEPPVPPSQSQEVINDSQEQSAKEMYISTSSSSQTEPDSSQPSFFIPESPTESLFGPASVSGFEITATHRQPSQYRTESLRDDDGFQIPPSHSILSSQTQPETFEIFNTNQFKRLPLSQRLRPETLQLQSSMTEPDFSQWGQDPFGEENEGFQRFSGRMAPETSTSTPSCDEREEDALPVKLKSRTADTQDSTTQSDDEEVLDLVKHPLSLPLSKYPLDRTISASTVDRDAVEEGLFSQSQSQMQALDVPASNADRPGDRSEGNYAEGYTYQFTESPMPDIGSEGGEPIILSPRRMRHTVAAVRDALDVSTDKNASRLRAQDAGEKVGGVDWEGVKAVQDFFGMFSPSQSQDESM